MEVDPEGSTFWLNISSNAGMIRCSRITEVHHRAHHDSTSHPGGAEHPTRSTLPAGSARSTSRSIDFAWKKLIARARLQIPRISGENALAWPHFSAFDQTKSRRQVKKRRINCRSTLQKNQQSIFGEELPYLHATGTRRHHPFVSLNIWG